MATVLGVVLLAATFVFPGCGPTCKELRSDYKETVAEEIPDAQKDETEDEKEGPAPQMAVGVRTAMLEKLAMEASGEAIKAVLSVSEQLDVGGESPVAVESLPEIETLNLSRPKDACPHCFEVSGELTGMLDVRIPAIGQRSVPMDGTFSFVAPLTLVPGDDGETTALQLDLAEATRHNAPLIALNVSDLRNTWASTIEQLLASTLADPLLEQFEPVTLTTFKTPDFGLENVEIQPVGLRISDDAKAVQALVSTNLPVLDPPDAETLAAAAKPTGKRDISLAVPTRVVAAGLVQGFRSGEVSRRYGLQGDASDKGPVRVTLGDIEAPTADANQSEDVQPLSFDFRAWHLKEGGPCYWFDGNASGAIAIEEESLEVDLDNVTFTDTSRSELMLTATNWRSADFLEKGTKLFDASLDKNNLDLPGGPYQFSHLGLDVRDDIVALSARIASDLEANSQQDE